MFFFLGFYFALVQYILPKMARILKYRQEKIEKIQTQASSYLSETQTQQDKRWNSYVACLNIQKKLADALVYRKKEVNEVQWENTLALKNQTKLNEAFSYDYDIFNQHMLNQNSSLAYLFLIKKTNSTLSSTLNNCYFLDACSSKK